MLSCVPEPLGKNAFAGNRMLQDLLRLRGVVVGPKHVATVMRLMGIAALYRHPEPHPGQQVFPYLLREHEITTPNQVWAMDLTCLSMRHEFLYGPIAYGTGRPTPDMVYFGAQPHREAA